MGWCLKTLFSLRLSALFTAGTGLLLPHLFGFSSLPLAVGFGVLFIWSSVTLVDRIISALASIAVAVDALERDTKFSKYAQTNHQHMQNYIATTHSIHAFLRKTYDEVNS